MRTIDDVQRDMAALLEPTEGRALNAQEITGYEELEREMTAIRASDAVRARQAAYDGPAPVTPPPLAAPGTDPVATDAYRNAFHNYLRSGQPSALLEQGQPLAQQSSGIPSEGGFLVPTTFRQKMVEALKSYGGLGEVVDTYTTGDGRPVSWVTIDDTAVTGEIVEENGTFSAGADLEFGDASLGAYSYATSGKEANPIRVPWELIQDAVFDVEALIARLFAIRIRRLQAAHLISGTGIKQPLGIVTGRIVFQATANTGFTWQDAVKIKHSIDPAYRAGARWAFNDNMAQILELMVDSHGDPVYLLRGSRDLRSSIEYDTFLGFPVTIDQGFSNYAPAAASPAGVFGNLQEGYVRRLVRDVQMVADPYSRSRYRQTEISAWARMDATQQNTAAYTVFGGKA